MTDDKEAARVPSRRPETDGARETHHDARRTGPRSLAALPRCAMPAERAGEIAFSVVPTARRAEAVVAEVAGEIDLRTVEVLRAGLLELNEAGFSRLVLDFGQVRFCDATGLGALVGVHNQVAAGGGEVVLCGVRPAQRRLLRITGLDRVFTLYDRAEDALGGGRATTPTAHG